MAITHEAAAGEVAAVLSQLQAHIDQEVQRVTPAAAGGGDAGAAAEVAAEATEGESLLGALHGCTRQLARLRDTLSAQACVPPEACSNEGQKLVVVEEGHKTQSALLHAQQVAEDMFHASVAQLDDAGSTEAAARQTKVRRTVDTCDRAKVVTTGALFAVISALSDLSSSPPHPPLPSHSSQREAGPGSGAASAAAVDGTVGFSGGGGTAGGGGQETRGHLRSARRGSFGEGMPAGASIAINPVVTLKGAAPAAAPARSPAAAKAESMSRDGSSSSSSSGSSGVFNPGIHRSSTGRSCRSHAARPKSGDAQPRKAKAPSAVWGPAPMAGTATEAAVALGLNPVTRAGVHVAEEGRRGVTSRGGLQGGGIGGIRVGSVAPTERSRFVRGKSAESLARSEAPPSRNRNRKLSPEEQRENEAASTGSTRLGGQQLAAAAEAAAPFRREVGSSPDGGVKLAAKHTKAAAMAAAAAATISSASRTSSRTAAAAAAAAAGAEAGAGALSFDRRGDGHRASPAVVSRTLSSPSGMLRQRSERSIMRGAQQSGGSGASPYALSSAAGRRVASAARPRQSAGAGGSGRHAAASANAAANHANSSNRNNNNDDDDHPGRALDMAFREGLGEHFMRGFIDEAGLDAFLSSGSSALGSPRRSLSTSRTARRQGLLDLHSAAGGGRTGGGGAAPAAAAAAAAAAAGVARQTRSRSAGRVSVASRSRAPAAGAAAIAEGGGGGDVGGGGTSWYPPPPGMDADEAAARRFAKQEQEAQAREDELMALRLAAREEARAERRAERHRNNARRNSHPAGYHHHHHHHLLGFDIPSAAAAALAAALMGQEGAGDGGAVGVSDAVRALQFQDIEANDYETLLALDEGGGEGGRCCAGGRGLTEEEVEGVLRPERAAGERLEESCAICMTPFERDDEISALPCLHAFHGACIRKWLLIRNRCPTDMQPVAPDSPAG